MAVAFDPAAVSQAQQPAFSSFLAIWDTGATNCAISQRVVDTCGLKPIGMTRVQTAKGLNDAEEYLVNIALPNGITIPGVRATKGDLGTTDMLIGMDIIALGDFSVTNKNGNTVFSFRMPSMHTVDYVSGVGVKSGSSSPILQQGFQHGGGRKRR